MSLVIVATKKKLSKRPMQLLLEALAHDERIEKLVTIELELLKCPEKFLAAFERVDLSTAVLIHKPHELFTSANRVELRLYQRIESRFLRVQDTLTKIKRIHHRWDMHQMLATLTTDTTHVPNAYLLKDSLTAEALSWADSCAPFLLKPNDSNNHCIYLVKDSFSLGKLYMKLLGERDKLGTDAERPLDILLQKCNGYYLMEQYVAHAIVFKIYSHRGRVIHMDFRAPLNLTTNFSTPAAGTTEAVYLQLNTQTDLSIQTSICYNPTPKEQALAEHIARSIYVLTDLSILGIDALSTDSGMFIIDLNYFSGPKLLDWEVLKRLLIEDLFSY